VKKKILKLFICLSDLFITFFVLTYLSDKKIKNLFQWIILPDEKACSNKIISNEKTNSNEKLVEMKYQTEMKH
jgi:hypothetical protein